MSVLVSGILIPLIAVFIVSMAIVALPTAVRAARGEGIEGSFVAERRECSARGCAHHGTWRADPPGTVVIRDVLMDEWPNDLPLGSVVPAVYLGETDPLVVYPADGSAQWFFMSLTVAGAAVVAVVGIRTLVRERREERRARLRSAHYRPRRVLHTDGDSASTQP